MTSNMHKLKDPGGNVVCGQLSCDVLQQRDAFDKMMNVPNTIKKIAQGGLAIAALWTDRPEKPTVDRRYNSRLQR